MACNERYGLGFIRGWGAKSEAKMTQPETDPADDCDEPQRRYGQFTAGDALVVYDREDTARWLQSELVVSLADMR
ncbi:hypothetical protein SAMN05216218_106150 [Halorientalis regularis]|jgi:hypothetical protein|uniref:Uncharacterized protein n=2 Tax=Halorientalis regularis TaxID=660518 RepID=A0A1G7L482_9EURY|nr:hypothetical protein SAMN05216218_106150 [Halorientalis regularis]